MFPALKLRASPLASPDNLSILGRGKRGTILGSAILPCVTRRPPFASLSVRAVDDAPEQGLVSSVGIPPPVTMASWNLNQKHILMLSVIACTTAISATWLFLSAIPALLAFKRASESLEKLLDVTREELPDTMAAVRLSGMEISDLTMELSDLGQEITQGVRSSTRAVRLAEDRLRRLTNMGPSPTALLQAETSQKSKMEEPEVAKNARRLREGIVQGRMAFQVLSSLTQFSKWTMNFLAARGRKVTMSSRAMGGRWIYCKQEHNL
ncbi:hypothetical protein H6P81_011152 [Aristolochia fimbriata]|uniref:Uncharacterized protein n=1 Tax=Aristolochia fimbriata TaxID=158543 RepID=A0AAV7EU73_ARIFI|nr:hypothetical protein H6P81_011152 [Aristolochia fimbriata]